MEDEGKSLYELLGVDRAASTAEIRKAYHRLALCCHPDKHAPGDVEAKERFQALTRVKEVLLDEERRKLYDATGLTGDEEEAGAARFRGKSFDELRRYFREMHAAVSAESIAEYEAEYVGGSAAEAADVLEHYARTRGTMARAAEYVPYAEEADLWRFRQLLEREIAAGRAEALPGFAAFRPARGPSDAERKARARRSLEERRSAPGAEGGGDELFQLIRARQESRAGAQAAMLDALADKYAGGPKPRRANGAKPSGGVRKAAARKPKGQGRRG